MYQKILEVGSKEVKDYEFAKLFTDVKARAFVSFTQIHTHLEVLVPDEDVTNVAERYNLYNDISKLDDEAQLNAFRQLLRNRFGPIPRQVEELLNTLRLKWLGKEIGLEKESFKKNVLRGYFATNPATFERDGIGTILQFAQKR